MPPADTICVTQVPDAKPEKESLHSSLLTTISNEPNLKS